MDWPLRRAWIAKMSTKAANATNGNTDGSTLAAMIGSAGMAVAVCLPPDAVAKPTAALTDQHQAVYRSGRCSFVALRVWP